jgi:hypothetical protein
MKLKVVAALIIAAACCIAETGLSAGPALLHCRPIPPNGGPAIFTSACLPGLPGRLCGCPPGYVATAPDDPGALDTPPPSQEISHGRTGSPS